MQQNLIRVMVLIGGSLVSILTSQVCFARVEPLKADYIVIEKEKRLMKLLHNGQEIRTYQIALGRNPLGPKVKEGDMRTPEGRYLIDFKKKQSKFHLALHVSYPSYQDKIRAKKLGVDPGRDIMIHGLKKGFEWLGSLHTKWDWTAGCIAVTNSEIEEIWKLVHSGTGVEIRP